MSAPPVLYHDPTSEPSRAVHWFCLEAGIAFHLHLIWLTRGEHRSPKLLRVNPRHQVPALEHGPFTLSETTAIIRYLAEWSERSADWLGETLVERARIDQLLSWYHANPRRKITLDYFLPTLLMPVYHGFERPDADTLARLQEAFRECLEQLEDFLGGKPFVAGERITAPDLVLASELFVLDADPDRERLLEPFPALRDWLERLRRRPACRTVNRCWDRLVPVVEERLNRPATHRSDPGWVADLCRDTEAKAAVAPS